MACSSLVLKWTILKFGIAKILINWQYYEVLENVLLPKFLCSSNTTIFFMHSTQSINKALTEILSGSVIG